MTERQKTLIWKKTQAQRNRFSRVMTREWKKALIDQIQPVIAEINESTVRDMEDRIPQLITEERIEEQLMRTVEIVGLYFAKATFRDINKAMNDQLITKLGGMPTDEDWIRRVTSILGLSAGARITAMTGESKAQAIEIIKATLTQAAEEGMGVSQMSQLLRDNLNEQWGKISTYRAARIARTETAMASNLGSLTGAKQAGIPLKKEWVSNRDSRTRRDTRGGRYPAGRYDHYGKYPSGPDGEKVDLGERFIKTGEALEYPLDPSGSAGNIINCRCTMIFDPIEINY